MRRLLWIAGSVCTLPLIVAACSSEETPGDVDAGSDGSVATTDGSTSGSDAASNDSGTKADTSTKTDASADGSVDSGDDGSLDGGSLDASDGATADASDGAPPPPPPPVCGVGFPRLCNPGEACMSADDCEGLCTGNLCDAPSHTDGKLSPTLGETDIDCGGPDAVADPALRCENAQTCAAATDCKSTACSPKTNTCVAGVSCAIPATASTSGIESCGLGEPGAATNESCCATLPLPTTTTRRLDKYEITAGRIRRFVQDVTATYGAANVRQWAKDYGGSYPTSQLGQLYATYPDLFDVLPASAAPTAKLSLVTALGTFAVDPINTLDGCYVNTGAEGHSTYWWDNASRSPFGLPARLHSQATLDAKPINCTMSLIYIAFCAWDGGELARMTDYREVWGNRPQAIAAGNVYVPWEAILTPGEFNWRNGQHGGFTCPNGWPGCIPNTQPVFYTFPTTNINGTPVNVANDMTPLISAPGRFAADVTRLRSASGDGWYDVGGLSLESGWVDNPPTNPSGAITDFCDTSASPGPGETACMRGDNAGVYRYQGPLPHLPLVGYSWEGHARYNEAYLANRTANPGSYKPVTWQYGKGGGRCARTY